ncbi:MAG TPA: hypothetical protein VN814_17395 [Caulobacteraceae bacterium]|nr:hypothetical protein [Caulobacteraceae bacterium]
MTLRSALLAMLTSSALLAGVAAAGPASNQGAGHPVQYAPPGPCGVGRVQKTSCEQRRHPPAPPITVCKRVCVPL